MTSDPSLATLLSNALTCPRPTIHTSCHHHLEAWVACRTKPSLADRSKQLKMSNRERKTLDGRFAFICKGVPVYAPVCPLWGPVCPLCCFWMSDLSSRPETEVQGTWGWTRDHVPVLFGGLACGGGLPWGVVRHLPVLLRVGSRKKVFSSFYILLMWIFNAVLFPISDSHGFTGTERVTKSSRPWLHYICCPLLSLTRPCLLNTVTCLLF